MREYAVAEIVVERGYRDDLLRALVLHDRGSAVLRLPFDLLLEAFAAV